MDALKVSGWQLRRPRYFLAGMVRFYFVIYKRANGFRREERAEF